MMEKGTLPIRWLMLRKWNFGATKMCKFLELIDKAFRTRTFFDYLPIGKEEKRFCFERKAELGLEIGIEMSLRGKPCLEMGPESN